MVRHLYVTPLLVRGILSTKLFYQGEAISSTACATNLSLDMKKSTSLAPIALFVYKRLDTLETTVRSLQDNYLAKESDLFIFSDAAKHAQDEHIVESVRTYVKSISGFKSITILESAQNKGLAKSIIAGVTTVIGTYGKVIVLEDDLQTTPNFLTFMNAGLDRYRLNRRVFSVAGFSFNLGIHPDETNDVYFLNRGWPWGWAIWQDRWQEIDWDVVTYPSFIRDTAARRRFAQGGSDLNKMLDDQMAGKLDSWAVRWSYYQFCTGGLTVYPVLSKVYNNGFDGNATHTHGSNKRYIPRLDDGALQTFVMPDSAQISPYYQRKFQEKMGYISRIISKVQTAWMNFSSLSR